MEIKSYVFKEAYNGSSKKPFGIFPCNCYLRGAIFETACVSELRKQTQVMPTMPHFYHWRSHSGAEVDIILHYNGTYYPIEIKGKTNPSRTDTKGISAFRNAYPSLNIAPGLVLCACQRIQQISDNDYALPWNWAL